MEGESEPRPVLISSFPIHKRRRGPKFELDLGILVTRFANPRDMSSYWARGLACLALFGGTATSLSCTSKGVKWAESRAPSVRVNQLGYLPQGPKWATVRSSSPEPLEAHIEHLGKVVYRGSSTPWGLDEASGDPIHHVDFSIFATPGEGYVLRVGDGESFPFAIKEDLYRQLAFDALKYFYHNRSGIEIVQPYVPAQTYTRPPGHLSDSSVPCWVSTDCAYRLDVSGGWYDAGDHGKYVVNGGISAWTLLALYERLHHVTKTASAWGDRTLNIPESGNGIPDILDEARYEVEFLLKMQVPDGQPLSGMAHHKIHDNAWTPLAIEPPETTEQRALHPPSTAATLNLAAVAAQASRLWFAMDPVFSQRCIAAAERAYQAAREHPARFAPEMDKNGGGPYADRHVDDEFFWAEAELFITTGRPEYLESLKQSPHFSRFPTRLVHEDGSVDGDGVTASMTWQSTAALGWISLAIVPSHIEDEHLTRIRSQIVAAARAYLRVIEKEGYRQPLGLGKDKKYPWGSNSFILNNMIVLSLGHDLTGEREYAEGVAQGMDYILGRNPMVQSYITGYGTNPLKQPHHRFWANSKDSRFPEPPPGAVSGGPNSSLQDPQTKLAGLNKSLPPQKCFVDHIDAWSVNEITINWNAPLAWAAVFLDEWRGK